MNSRYHLWRAMLTVSLIFSVAGFARSQGAAGHAAVLNMAEMKFGMIPGMPTCSTGSVQSGDPSKGPSIILARTAAGCSVPWHWHTPNEHLMMVTGVAQLEMKDGKSQTLRAGGYAMMTSRHVHQFLCTRSCTFYVHSDAAFDIHYVDGQGKEIPPADALKAVRKTAPKKVK